MVDYSLPASELAAPGAAHRATRGKRDADRIKAVILLARGWSAEDVADALLIDPNTVRNHFKRYQQSGLPGLLQVAYRGSDCELDAAQLAELDAHLQTPLYLSANNVAARVAETFGILYTVSGMTAVLHRLGFVYKKPKLVPGKAERTAQQAFLAECENLKQNKGENDVILFMDAVHPQHNPVLGYGWIKRGEHREVPSNTGRRRLNINGAVDLERLEPVVRLRRHHRCRLDHRLVRPAPSHLRLRRLHLEHLRQRSLLPLQRGPGLSAGLSHQAGLPARLCPEPQLHRAAVKFFKKQVRYDRYYESFDDSRAACNEDFNNPQRYRGRLQSLLTENVAVVGL